MELKNRNTRVFIHLLAAVAVLATALAPLPAFADDAPPADPAAAASQFVAYYFHGNVRCATCRKLEALSEESIRGGFPEAIASGRLEWRLVNTDESENKHFVQDFQLVTKSLVLVEERDGKVVRSENLRLVWQLVNDHDGFVKYVRDATRAFLGEG